MPSNLKTNFLTRHPLMAVFLFTFICLLPAMLMRDFTPSNELRYLSIADEAIANGNIFAFYNHGLPYADKRCCRLKSFAREIWKTQSRAVREQIVQYLYQLNQQTSFLTFSSLSIPSTIFSSEGVV